MCNTLEIHIELISLTSDGESRVEHYGKECDEQYNLGLAKGHYFINGYTQLTSYCLEKCAEVKDIKDCSKIFKTYNGKSKKCNDRCIKAFQVFKMLIDTGDKLITPMELTDEVLNTQLYDKVDDYKTLHYNTKNYIL